MQPERTEECLPQQDGNVSFHNDAAILDLNINLETGHYQHSSMSDWLYDWRLFGDVVPPSIPPRNRSGGDYGHL